MQKSEQIGELAAALAKAHAAFEKVTKDRVNPYYKSRYADLGVIIDATRKALSDNGLSVIQSPAEAVDSMVHIETTLIHISGQWIMGRASIPVSKWDAQGVGSALTYGRRYALQSLLNVAAEDDDDGNAAIENTQEKIETAERRFEQAEGDSHISDFRRAQFDKNCEKHGRTPQQIETFLGDIGNYKQSEHILNKDWEKAIAWAANPNATVPRNLQDTMAALNRNLDMVEAKKAAKTQGKCPACGTRMLPSKLASNKGELYCPNKEACPTRQKGYKKPNGAEDTTEAGSEDFRHYKGDEDYAR